MTPIIEFKNVTVGYDGKPVLKDISFKVEEGEFWAIVGPNGTGKTTLVKTILGLIPPMSGVVYVFGCPAKRVCPHRKMIGYVPQTDIADPNFPVTSLDVVMTGSFSSLGPLKWPGKKIKKKAIDLLNEVGLAQFKDHPFGRLSGGQKRRVMIARALMGDPRALILDEPLQGVDVSSQEKLIELIEKLHRERKIPILFITHNVNPVLHLIKKVIILGVGIHFVGTREILFDRKILKSVYGKEIEVIRTDKRDFIITNDHHA